MKEVEVEGLNQFLDEIRRMPGLQLATQGEVAKAYRRDAAVGGGGRGI